MYSIRLILINFLCKLFYSFNYSYIYNLNYFKLILLKYFETFFMKFSLSLQKFNYETDNLSLNSFSDNLILFNLAETHSELPSFKSGSSI